MQLTVHEHGPTFFDFSNQRNVNLQTILKLKYSEKVMFEIFDNYGGKVSIKLTVEN